MNQVLSDKLIPLFYISPIKLYLKMRTFFHLLKWTEKFSTDFSKHLFLITEFRNQFSLYRFIIGVTRIKNLCHSGG